MKYEHWSRYLTSGSLLVHMCTQCNLLFSNLGTQALSDEGPWVLSGVQRTKLHT